MNKNTVLGTSTAMALAGLMGMYEQPKMKKKNKSKAKMAKASKKRNRK